MKTILTINIFLIFIIICGCGQKKTDDISTGRDTISPLINTSVKFVLKELFRSYKDCKPGEVNCTYIKLNYIEATETNIKDKINKIINNELITAYEMPDKNLNNAELMAETFMNDYKNFKKMSPQLPEIWSIDYTAKVHGETDKILCLSFFNSNYLGGTHPNTNTVFRNINKETGDTISLKDLFGNGFEEKLNTLIDKKYRETKGLKTGDNLADKGGLFENKITFTFNFAVNSDRGIGFYYNAYDIAPYVLGPVAVKLSAEDIAGILTGSSPLK